MLRTLFVDFNSFFASVEQHLEPKLRGRPVGVVPVEAESTCCIAASAEAKAFGVKTGTPVYEARRRCPGIVFVLAQHAKYVKVHHDAIAVIDRVFAEALDPVLGCPLRRPLARPRPGRAHRPAGEGSTA